MLRYALTAFAILLTIQATQAAEPLPKNIVQQLPKNLSPLQYKKADLNGDQRADYLVATHDPSEKELMEQGQPAPRRPLLIFTQNQDDSFTLARRNDAVIYAIDEGGQCDPFLDDEEGLAVKGAYFTVENSVACGAHWTDYITFRYAPELQDWVFHKRIAENWVMNPSTKPDAEALILGNRSVSKGKKDHPIFFHKYRPN